MSRSVCQSCRETNGQQKARRLLTPRLISPDGLIDRANIHPLSPLQPPLLFSSVTNKKSCHLDRCTTIVVWHILRPQNVPLPNLGGGPTPTACQQCVLGSPLFSSVVTVSTGHCHTVIGGKGGVGHDRLTPPGMLVITDRTPSAWAIGTCCVWLVHRSLPCLWYMSPFVQDYS